MQVKDRDVWHILDEKSAEYALMRRRTLLVNAWTACAIGIYITATLFFYHPELLVYGPVFFMAGMLSGGVFGVLAERKIHVRYHVVRVHFDVPAKIEPLDGDDNETSRGWRDPKLLN
jgi:hypothetical protein